MEQVCGNVALFEAMHSISDQIRQGEKYGKTARKQIKRHTVNSFSTENDLNAEENGGSTIPVATGGGAAVKTQRTAGRTRVTTTSTRPLSLQARSSRRATRSADSTTRSRRSRISSSSWHRVPLLAPSRHPPQHKATRKSSQSGARRFALEQSAK